MPKPKKNTNIKQIVKISFILILGLFLSFLIILFIQTRYWSKQQFNLGFLFQNQAGVLSFQPQSQRLVIISFPANTLISTAGGLGDYRAKNIYLLGEQAQLGGGWLWQYSLEKTLGLMVDAYLIKTKALITTLNKKTILSQLLWPSGWLKKTNSLNLFERLYLSWFILARGTGDLVSINLEQEGLIEVDQLADGSGVFRLPPELSDKLVQDFLIEPAATKNPVRLAIFNASGYSNLGEEFRRLMTNSGATVIQLANTDESEYSVIKSTDEAFFNNYLVKKIIKKYNFKTEVVDYIHEGRGEVGVFLGKDFSQNYRQLQP